MKVVLTKTIMEGGSVKCAIRPGHAPVVFISGAVIEMSDASAAKYIADGLAEALPSAEEKASG